MGFRRGFKANSNRIALRVREQMGLRARAPIDPIEVCSFYEIRLIALSDVALDCSRFLGVDRAVFSAVTVPCGPQTAIVHNDSHHPHRQRSNICHELAHCFLGHQCTPPLTTSGERNRDGGIEAEANFLAGNLLITNEAAIHIVCDGHIDEAQEYYGVSRDMLTYRLRMSGAYAIGKRKYSK